jgi:hypothetical protein
LFHCALFSLFFSPHYYVPLVSRLRIVICQWSSAGPWRLRPPFVLFFCFYFVIFWTDFYWLVLCSGLLITFLSQFSLILCPKIRFWCLPALLDIFLQWTGAGRWLSAWYIVVLVVSVY